MLRPEYAVAGYIHHAVAHNGANKHSYRSYDHDALERRRARTDGRCHEVDRVVADTHHEVKHSENKQKNYDTQKDIVHTGLFFVSETNSVCKIKP